jgi:hypothetical protein
MKMNTEPITDSQKNMILFLTQKNEIVLEKDLTQMTKAEASKLIDSLKGKAGANRSDNQSWNCQGARLGMVTKMIYLKFIFEHKPLKGNEQEFENEVNHLLSVVSKMMDGAG